MHMREMMSYIVLLSIVYSDCMYVLFSKWKMLVT